MNRILVAVVLGSLVCGPAGAEETLSPAQAAAALRKAVEFFRTQVSVQGGYLWRYSGDLKLREGEGKASETTAWVQPPGTPTVGEAFLSAWDLVGDVYYREAARETALALVRGQLRSGGWDYRIEFASPARDRSAYRVETARDKQRNETTLDDDTTQAAVRFLMRVDRALDFQDATIHEAALYALTSLRRAQYPNGAWPQRYSEFPDPQQFPVLPASFPASWSRTHPAQDYRAHYTFNDNTIADLIDTLIEAWHIYGDETYLDSAKRAGDFGLLAQMPEPQPAWAQQYDAGMHPAWARKFEPPAITGGESQGVMRMLMSLARSTGDRKYLEPIPRAIAYLRKSQLPSGQLARFYELTANKPLYFTKQYELTYAGDDVPTHYAFVVASNLDAIQAECERLQKANLPEPKPAGDKRRRRISPSLLAQAERVVQQLDERGAWVENGRLRYIEPNGEDTPVIDCRTFVNNVQVLSRFIAASRPER